MFIFISAERETNSIRKNKELHASLGRDIQGLLLDHIPCTGHYTYNNGEQSIEASYMVHIESTLDLNNMLKLRSIYNQESVLHVDENNNCVLRYENKIEEIGRISNCNDTIDFSIVNGVRLGIK